MRHRSPTTKYIMVEGGKNADVNNYGKNKMKP